MTIKGSVQLKVFYGSMIYCQLLTEEGNETTFHAVMASPHILVFAAHHSLPLLQHSE